MIEKGRKIGRNESCPCSSGKKFKHCCEKKGITHLPNTENEKPHLLSVFNRDFLLDEFSKAFLIPENHGKNIRIERLIRESLKYGNPLGGSRDKNKLKNLIDKNYYYDLYEDPPEHLFSDNIVFFGGNYVVFPGIFATGQFVLSNLLMTLFFSENNVTDKTKAIIYSKALLLLNISNEIANRANINRYKLGIDDTNLISLNNDETISTFISYQTIKEWCVKYNLDFREIFSFTLTENEFLDSKAPDKNPIVMRPLIQQNEGIKVLSVTNLQGALLHSIFVELIKSQCLEQVIKVYTEFVWYSCVESHLRKMNINPISIDSFQEMNDMKLGAYKIDVDKIMIIILHQDNGQGYNEESIYSSSYKADIDDKFRRNITDIIQTVFPEHEILLIYLSSGIGRLYSILFNRIDFMSIGMAVCDFDLIMKLREYDALSLWNYAQAKTKFLTSTKLSMMSDELDVYSIYHNKEHSFYLGDEEKSDYLAVLPGTALSFREEIYLKEDIHSIPYINNAGDLGGLTCLKITGFGDNTYHPLNSDILQRVVKSSNQPIWVRFAGNIYDIALENRSIYINMLEALSYWIWQFIDSLEEHLNTLPKTPIILTFDFQTRFLFEKIHSEIVRNPNIENEFKIEASNNFIKILIPESLNAYLYGSDNIGERYLVKAILKGFSILQSESTESSSITLSENEIERIINIHAPIGIKKKIFLIDIGNDICLYPVEQKPRYIQKYNINLILDELVPRIKELGIITDHPGAITNQDELLKAITSKVLLPWLNNELKIYDSALILEYLYKQLEALIYTRRSYLLTLPTTIACFANYDKQVEKLIKVEHDLTQTNTSVRCLIEHIVALPVNKGKIPSQSALDQMLAIMEQIIAWGMMHDRYYYGLTETTMEILPSGRIGTNHDIESDVLLPFRESRAKENISDSIDAFDRIFNKKEVTEDQYDSYYNRIDNAFLNDYGISLTRILDFSNALIELALQQTNNSYCTMIESELRKKTVELLTDITDQELDNLINYYSLSQRESFWKPPTGFENYDISPWRYNRGLSLLRKPILRIKGEMSEDQFIWGARQVYIASYQILSLFFSGKLRCKEDGELSILKGEILDKKGSEFTSEVFEHFNSTLQDCIIDKEVLIKPGATLSASKDLGDIDICIIERVSQKIFLIECKNTTVAKTVKEMVEEVEHLFGKETKKGWIDKHKERLDWVNSNLHQLEKKYSLELKNFEIHAAVLTSEQLPTKYLKRDVLPFPMVSFYDVKENSLDTFL